MIVSGFTFLRNGVKYDYPFEESIRSLLPLVDEMIVNVGDSEDETLERVKAINDPKIKIIESVWDPELRKDGLVYAQQTNIALEAVRPDADWAFYLQGDELVHEKDLEGFRRSMEMWKNDPRILGLMMRYKHFVGDYWSLDPWAYRRALRIVRPGKVISVGDAVGFARVTDKLYIGNKEKHLWRYADGPIYHYGWVKSPALLREKVSNQVKYYWDGTPKKDDAAKLAVDEFMPPHYKFLKPFTGTHPSIMHPRISSFPLMPRRVSRWLNPRFYAYVLRHGFKG
jgi:glycosyltransferase involved in cell wall biosynthesis